MPEPTDASYKVVEITKVFDEEIEAELNRWTAEGFRFDSIHFVTQPGNRRPSMAFLFFSRVTGEGKG
ncbi:MAG: hypothetical protein WBX49_07770 [Candidatus Deferrimicrobiaceae bacterium]